MKKSEWAPGVYENFMETYDFQTCQRADGTYYGTGGTCRKGTPATLPEKEKSNRAKAKEMAAAARKEAAGGGVVTEASLNKKFEAGKNIGGGEYGEVSLTSAGTVVKKGLIGQDEIGIQKELAKDGLAPEIKGAVMTGAAKGSEPREGIVEMGLAKGKPYSQLEKTLSDSQKAKAAEEYLRIQKSMHMKGISHGDFHEENYFFDAKTGKGTAIDFGLSKKDKGAALTEAITNQRLFGRGDWIQRTNSAKVKKWDKNLDKVIRDMDKKGKITPSGRLSKKMTKKEYQEYLDRIYGDF